MVGHRNGRVCFLKKKLTTCNRALPSFFFFFLSWLLLVLMFHFVNDRFCIIGYVLSFSFCSHVKGPAQFLCNFLMKLLLISYRLYYIYT